MWRGELDVCACVLCVCVCACGTVRAVRTERQAAGRAAESDGSADGWRRVCADVCVCVVCGFYAMSSDVWKGCGP